MNGPAAGSEDGFTLIEVLIATAIFVFVAVAGFETLRQLGMTVGMLGMRAGAAAALNTALGQLRSDAVSATAVWLPKSSCGTAVSMMRRDASGTAFTTYAVRGNALVRASAAGPIDPCAAALNVDTVLGNVTAVVASAFTANALPSHVDPIGGAADGGFFRGGIPSVSVSSHALDYDGTPIMTGNAIVELSVDADPAEATVDLVPGNRPNAYTDVLTYACGPRCRANSIFPEIASLDVASCTADAPDLPDSSAFYVASATGLGASGRIVTTAYAVHLRYAYTFAGASPPVTAYRVGPTFTWPAVANLNDAYPVDYGANAARATGPAALAAFAGPPPNLATEAGVCAGMDAEQLFHG